MLFERIKGGRGTIQNGVGKRGSTGEVKQSKTVGSTESNNKQRVMYTAAAVALPAGTFASGS